MLSKSVKLLRQQALKQFCQYSGSTEASKTRLGMLGVPFAKGQRKVGVDLAPDLLRNNNLISTLESAASGALVVSDYGNLQFETDQNSADLYKNTSNYADFMGCNRTLIKKVQDILKTNDQFLTIGGDHAIGFGSVAGHLMHTPNLSLVWVDAHADINLHTTSESGNIHGMPVSLLLQELRKYWEKANLKEIAPVCLPADQLVYIGLRDVDPYEAYILNKLGIRAYAMDSVDRYGIQKIMEMTLDALKPENKIHVSFDIDALDNVWAPSTGTVVEGGLTLREGISIVEALRDTNRVQGIDLVELNPKIGRNEDVERTVTSCLEILKSVCGYKRAGNWSNINLDLFKTN